MRHSCSLPVLGGGETEAQQQQEAAPQGESHTSSCCWMLQSCALIAWWGDIMWGQ